MALPAHDISFERPAVVLALRIPVGSALPDAREGHDVFPACVFAQEVEQDVRWRLSRAEIAETCFAHQGSIYGHSDRPRSTIWTPEAQADLINTALLKLGVSRAVILGHSWGTLVALAIALKYQHRVQGLILASGYYYPTIRADVLVLSAPSVPVLGDIVRHTISPILSRLIWPLMLRKLFGPNPVPPKFKGFPKEMAVRPSQIRAGAAEAALMIPSVTRLQGEYAKLQMPVAIIAGSDDRLIEPEQSVHLHRDISQSTFQGVASNGHMVHQTATLQIMSAIELVAKQDRPREVSRAA